MESKNTALVDIEISLGVVGLLTAKPSINPQPQCMSSSEAVAIADPIHQEGVYKQLKRRSGLVLGVSLTVPARCPRSSCRVDPGLTRGLG